MVPRNVPSRRCTSALLMFTLLERKMGPMNALELPLFPRLFWFMACPPRKSLNEGIMKNWDVLGFTLKCSCIKRIGFLSTFMC